MNYSALRIRGVDRFIEHPSPARHGASRVVCLLRASLLGGTALALLIGLGSGAWAQSQSVAGGLATGTNSLAVGSGSFAYSKSSLAIGPNAAAGSNVSGVTGDLATAVGAGAIASGAASTALGEVAYAKGVGASAVGAVSTASADDTTALGYGAKAAVANSVALGANSVAGAVDNAVSSIILGGVTYNFSGTQNVSVLSIGGTQSDGSTINRQIHNVAPGLLDPTSTDAVNGSQLDATNKALANILGANYGKNEGGKSLALGVGSVAGVNGDTTTDYFATAVGVSSKAAATYTTAVGVSSTASANYSTALGANSQATGSGSIALGSSSSASRQGAVALGLSSIASDFNASSIGANSRATSTGATAIGSGSHADGVESIAMGLSSEAVGSQAVAIGPSSIASSDGSMALGSGAQARVANSVALGAGSSVTGTANASGSVVLGGVSYAFSGAATAATPIVSVGGYVLDESGAPTTEYVTRQIQNVAAGALSATSTDAVNGSQLYATNQAVIATDAKIGALVNGSDVSVADRTNGVARKLLGVSSGALNATSTDGVNGSQLYATNQAVIATDAKIGAVVSGSDVSVADGMTGAARKLVNVSAGTLSATSTDAVNGSQLYATNQAVIATDAKIGAVVSGSDVSVADRSPPTASRWARTA